MASLVDTNILVYRCDVRDPAKRAVARETLRKGLAENQLCIPHQALIEFVHAVTRGRGGTRPLLTREEAWAQAEDFLTAFPIVYSNATVFRTALRGMATYGLPWHDAHLWAYAEYYGLAEILSEDFEHGRRYGTVRVRNPFVDLGLA